MKIKTKKRVRFFDKWVPAGTVIEINDAAGQNLLDKEPNFFELFIEPKKEIAEPPADKMMRSTKRK